MGSYTRCIQGRKMKEETGRRQKRALGRHLQKQEGHRQERSALVWLKDGGGGSRMGELAEGEEGGAVSQGKGCLLLFCCLVPLKGKHDYLQWPYATLFS